MSGQNDARWNAVVAAILASLSIVAFVLVLAWLWQPPVVETAAARANPNELIAYNIADRQPRLLISSAERLVYERLTFDWSDITSGSKPTWVSLPTSYHLPRTSDPASAFLPACVGKSAVNCDLSVDLAGEITDERIHYVEIGVDGVWQRHHVWGKGFIVPLGSSHLLGDIRWLDRELRTVWSLDRDFNGEIEPTAPPAGLRR